MDAELMDAEGFMQAEVIVAIELVTVVLSEDKGLIGIPMIVAHMVAPVHIHGRGRGHARDSGSTSAPKCPRNFILSVLLWEKLDPNTDRSPLTLVCKDS